MLLGKSSVPARLEDEPILDEARDVRCELKGVGRGFVEPIQHVRIGRRACPFFDGQCWLCISVALTRLTLATNARQHPHEGIKRARLFGKRA